MMQPAPSGGGDAGAAPPHPRLIKIISGGQTGADQAGLRAAKALGLRTGGWMPARFWTEDGFRPEFADLYGMRATASRAYAVRTRLNAREAELTVWFGDDGSAGYQTTRRAAWEAGRHWVEVRPAMNADLAVQVVACKLRETAPDVLNVAGHRESTWPGIGEFAEKVIAGALRRYVVPDPLPAA